MTRRGFVAAGAAAPLALAAGGAGARPAGADGFIYEIRRTEEEWRALLTPQEYRILREGGTELPASSDLWDETRAGTYSCKGCTLDIYASDWKVPLDKGWVFFVHAIPNAVLMGTDGPEQAYGMDPQGDNTLIEAHCRRCGSHLGHILLVEEQILHCINGRSLTFAPAAL